MKVWGVFLGPPSSTEKTTLMIKGRKRANIRILRIVIIRALNESAGRLFRAAKQHRKKKTSLMIKVRKRANIRILRIGIMRALFILSRRGM